MKDKIIEILNSYVDSKLGDSEDNISAYAVDSIADEIVNLLPNHVVIHCDAVFEELAEKEKCVVCRLCDSIKQAGDLINKPVECGQCGKVHK